MSLPQKIRIAALECENSDTAFLIGEGNQVTGTHAALGKVLAKLGASLFTIRVDLIFVLGNEQRLLQNRSPAQNVAQAAILRIVGIELRRARNGFEMNSPALVEG